MENEADFVVAAYSKMYSVVTVKITGGEVMNITQEPIAPEIIQILLAKAADSGLSMNEYLRRLLGLTGKPIANPTPIESVEEALQPEDSRLAALQRIAERQATRPFTKSADTVTMLREARAGAMWGYEPTE